ncbi:prepilin-type N-terminal cleavage/methylation domain-containing protein [bacterium]|nr:prepilin-type N-terminal cleavage/methylation domain-containing protein [bacterium]
MRISKALRPARLCERGITLVELVAVIVIVGIVAGLASDMIFYEIKMYDVLSSRKKGLQNSRITIQMIARDLRQIKSQADILQASADSVRFNRVDDVSRSYKFENEEILQNDDVMMNSVDSFQLTYITGAGDTLNTPITDPTQIRSIGLKLTTVVDGESIESKILVTPRNF